MAVNPDPLINSNNEVIDANVDKGQINVNEIVHMIEVRVQKAQSEIDEKIQALQASSITVFGLFASVLSFLTIEFQFLKTLTRAHDVIGFTLILWSLLVSFNLALDHIIKKTSPSKYVVPFTVVLLIIGIAFMLYGKSYLIVFAA